MILALIIVALLGCAWLTVAKGALAQTVAAVLALAPFALIPIVALFGL